MDPLFDYVSVADINNFMAQQQMAHPAICALFPLNPPSMGMRISNNAALPFVFVTGLQHGNEWISGSVVCTLISSLLLDQTILARYQFIFVPVVNHAGYTRSRNSLPEPIYVGRKTDLPVPGIDMNRNWPTIGWKNPGIAPADPTYPGTMPLQTVEGVALNAVLIANNPVQWGFDFHSYATSVLFPFADKDTDQPLGESRAEELRFMLDAATKMYNPERKFGLVVWNSQSGWSLYGKQSYGTMMDWNLEVRAARSAFTFELPPSQPPEGGFRPDREILPIVGKIVWQAFNEYLQVY